MNSIVLCIICVFLCIVYSFYVLHCIILFIVLRIAEFLCFVLIYNY